MKRLDHFLLPVLALGGILLLSCQRDDSTSPEADGTRPVAMRLVRTAEVDDYTWFETDSVKVVVKTSSGALLLEKTLAFTSGKLVFGTVSAPGDQGVTITATGYDKGKVIWTGASELAPSASEQTAVIDIRTGSTNSAGVVSAPEILSRSVSHWMTDPDSVKVYDRGVKVVLRNRRDSASYRYTFDGSVPNSKSKTYSADSGILIDSTSDLEVVGLKAGWTASAVTSESFRLRARPVTQDTLNVNSWAPSDTFDQPVTVKLGSETPNVEIRYTLDGKEPTRSSSLYTSAGVVVDSTRTLKAVAYTGKAERSTETYVRSFILRARDASVDSLSVKPWAGTETFDRPVTVKLGSKTPNAEIRYTLDGKEPTRSSPLYTSAGIVVDSTRTLKAVVFNGKAARSAGVLTKSFVMKAQTVSVGSISATAWAAPDTFDQAINVKLANPTPGVEIRYTLDGSTPKATSKLYTADGVAIDTNRTLKAMAWAGKQPSGAVFSRTFAFKARPATVASLSVEAWAAPDTFDQPVTVKLSSLTPNAEIRYTLDGTIPTRSSALYASAGVIIDTNRTLKAVVFAGKAARSAEVLSRSFAFKARSVTVASVSTEAWGTSLAAWATDTYDQPVTVKFACATPNAEIRYTLDGSTPTRTSSLYANASAGIMIDSTSMLNAVAFAGKAARSTEVLTRTFTLRARPATVASLSLDPWAPPDTFDRPVTAKLTSETPNAEIRYTLDGSTPTRSSALYTTAGVLVDSTRTLKAVVYTGKAARSTEVLSRSFTMKARALSVESISAAAWESPDTYDQVITVKLTNPTTGAEIRYTLDGSAPTQSSSLYATGGIVIDSTRTLKAMVFTGKQPSGEVLTRTFTLKARAANVTTLSVTAWADPDVFDEPVTVKLASETPNAEIRYTLDGSTPTRSSTLYTTAGVLVDSTRTLKAVVFAGKAARSAEVLTQTFSMKAQPVRFSVGQGLTTFGVALSSPTPGCVIRYTKDGTTPKASSSLYTDSLKFDQEDSVTIRAIAIPISSKIKPSTEASTRIGPGSFIDSRDGQTYKTVKIGAQRWMAQNLNFQADSSWYFYGSDADSAKKYGRLYKWAALMGLPDYCNSKSCASQIQAVHQGICPNGWHVPTDDEWSTLTSAIGGEANAGTKFKSKTGWLNNGNGTDEYGFTVLPAGNRYRDGTFYGVGARADFWSASEGDADSAWYLNFGDRYANVYRYYYDGGKSHGFSARCSEN